MQKSCSRRATTTTITTQTNFEPTMEDTEPKKKKARKIKPLPVELASLNDKDKDKFVVVLECDPNQKSDTFGQEFHVIRKVTIAAADPNSQPTSFDVDSLSLDQIRQLCKNVGVTNCGSMNKFQCRKAIAMYFHYRDNLEKKGLSATSYAARITSTICRAVNVVFSDQFIEDFKTVNDRKDRRDHESSNTHKQFWIRAALAHNDIEGDGGDIEDDAIDNDGGSDGDDSSNVPPDDDSFTTLVYPEGDTHLTDLDNNPEINLRVVNQFETEAFRKKITTLFKVRRTMKKNMTESGTHDSDPWNFVEVAMRNVTGLTKISVYYFYMRCEAIPGIDAHFQPFLDPSLKGSSVDIGDDDEDSSIRSNLSSLRSSASKKATVPDNTLATLAKQSSTMMQFLAEAKDDRKAMLEETKAMVAETKKKNKFNARLEVAKALGNTAELQKLMEEAKEME
jgi:hypothetical protein